VGSADLFGSATPVADVLVTLALTLVIGIEREEKSRRDGYLVGGVRTIPLIGLLGHALGLVGGGSPLPVALGFLGVAGLLAVEYQRRLAQGPHGATSEMAVLLAYLLGALVASGHRPVAAAMTVAAVLLLNAKVPLERFAIRLPRQEITTFVTFLLIAAVVLPILPDRDFTAYALNPFHTWLIVVAVSGLSYASYLGERLMQGDRSVVWTSLLGGAYSSTATTLVLARRSREEPDPWVYVGGTLLASAAMYLRLLVLLALFAPGPTRLLLPRLAGLALAAALAGALAVARRRAHAGDRPASDERRAGHPLELGPAVAFAGLFLAFSVATQLVVEHLGHAGLRALAALAGVSDVTPFVLGVAQVGPGAPGPVLAAQAILISAASNNVLKGLYALGFAERRTGLVSLAALAGLSVLTLLVLP
jgi:uncharacterized membrane protein (DUF4010 family)